MYGWIWRKLPFGLPGKIGISLALVVGTGLLLWYVVFPAAEPLLPFDDVQVTDENSGGGEPTEEPTPPYPTVDNPHPSSRTPSGLPGDDGPTSGGD